MLPFFRTLQHCDLYYISHVILDWSMSMFEKFKILLQQYFVCDYAINVECNTAETFYSLNDNFGQVPDSEDGDIVSEK